MTGEPGTAVTRATGPGAAHDHGILSTATPCWRSSAAWQSAVISTSANRRSAGPGGARTVPRAHQTRDFHDQRRETAALLDEASTEAQIAGSCDALRLHGASCLVVGAGGVGSAVVVWLAAEGPTRMRVFDAHAESAEGLAGRLRQHQPRIDARSGSKDPAGFDLVVNATPLG